MFTQLVCLLAVVPTTIAIPLNSHAVPRKSCGATLALVEDEANRDAIKMKSPEIFSMKRPKKSVCETKEKQPAIRLTSYPNTGVTWMQYLMEEATKVATQNPQSIVSGSGEGALSPDEPVNCRAECGAQIFLHPNCTAGSDDSNGVMLPYGLDPEIYKTHYPDYTMPNALFETFNPIQTTLLLVRNPLDTYLAATRHMDVSSGDKVGSVVTDLDIDHDPDFHIDPDDPNFDESGGCSTGYVAVRPETAGMGIDPLGICSQEHYIFNSFETFIPLWCDFFDFWIDHHAVECTDVTVVRYEDLAIVTDDVLQTVISEAGLTQWESDGITRAVEKFPVSASRLGKNIYFNDTLGNYNDTLKDWARLASHVCEKHVTAFGYLGFLGDLIGDVR